MPDVGHGFKQLEAERVMELITPKLKHPHRYKHLRVGRDKSGNVKYFEADSLTAPPADWKPSYVPMDDAIADQVVEVFAKAGLYVQIGHANVHLFYHPEEDQLLQSAG
jgi:hypothetical protein